MKKNILLIIIAIILILAGISVLSIKNCIFFVKKNVAEENPINNNYLSVSVIPIHQTDNFYNIQAEYPQFKNASDEFNKKIADLITEEIDNFKKSAKENWDARRATAMPDNPVPENPEGPFDFIATWKPVQLNNEYLSFVINSYYFVGGAHGANEVHAFNYDLAKQKEITILDFLNSSQQYFEKLAELSAKEVTSKLQGNEVMIDDFLKQMIQDGTKATQENYKDFNFNYNSLIIYFQQYQVAPGAAGEITITFYKNTLDKNSIKSDYLK
ncbi:MAG: DUF3298 and DUF4163 domain-containing protein [Candidatus Nealsonbacteria bacterium]|nr:DUF3298 and DUF4163 domain-containing protein [Candidatus Nealsonbacteria bacterium]